MQANTINKQIIIASDTSINDYKFLEERLKTRFRWGLTESINTPEIELKKNIIKNKIMINNYDLDLSEDVIDFIANNCGSDIRNLENAVLRLLAYKACLNIIPQKFDSVKTARICWQASFKRFAITLTDQPGRSDGNA